MNIDEAVFSYPRKVLVLDKLGIFLKRIFTQFGGNITIISNLKMALKITGLNKILISVLITVNKNLAATLLCCFPGGAARTL